jgi:alpha-glucosidase
MAAPFWQDGVLYQIYPRSFKDSSGDGVGDLQGVIDRLEHLEWLGIDGIWLTPIMVSPDRDMGYDVADYCRVQPGFGDLDTFERLIAEARRRRIEVILDLVPNHTSDQHPWFVEARSSRSSRYRDWYFFRDGKPDGSPPNDWKSAFGGPAWTLDQRTQQYYLHSFDPGQPDLNWRNPAVSSAFDEILAFWFDRGAAGFRIDVAHATMKDPQLRDGMQWIELPEQHDVVRHWRSIADGYRPPRILIGETSVKDVARMARYYGAGDELHMAFNFSFLEAPLEADQLRTVVEQSERLIPAGGWPVWTASNHDVSRFPSRWCQGSADRIRCVLLILLTLRGTPFIYYGDEIGMPDTPLTRADLTDPVGIRFWPKRTGRDPARTPMPWNALPGAGFTRQGVKPWLPLGDIEACNVEDQRRDEGSVLAFTRDLIALRRRMPALREGSYRSRPAPTGCWAWERGDEVTVAVNLSDQATRLSDVRGKILASTNPEDRGRRAQGSLTIEPWQGLVCSSAST